MNLVFDVVTAITCLITLIGFIYLAGYWKGQVDSFMRQSKECSDKYPLAELSVQLKTLWDVYGVGALSNKPGLASHHSPWHLTEKGRALIPEKVKAQMEQIPGLATDHTGIASSWLAIKTLGIDHVTQFASDTGLTLPEAVGLLGIYLECLRTNEQKKEG